MSPGGGGGGGGGGGEEQGILPQGPQTFKGPHEAFIFMILPLWAAFSRLSFTFPALSVLNERTLR